MTLGQHRSFASNTKQFWSTPIRNIPKWPTAAHQDSLTYIQFANQSMDTVSTVEAAHASTQILNAKILLYNTAFNLYCETVFPTLLLFYIRVMDKLRVYDTKLIIKTLLITHTIIENKISCTKIPRST